MNRNISFIKQVIAFGRIVKQIIKFGSYRSRVWVINEEKKVAFLKISRSCGTPMVNALYNAPEQEDISPIMYLNTKSGKRLLKKHMVEGKRIGYFGDLPDRYNDYFKFTYVRNPFERLVSTYEHKYHVNAPGYYSDYLFGFIAEDEGFETFIKKVVKIPYIFMEEHFALQYPLVYKKNKPVVGYVGKFEEIDETFPKILEKYKLGPMFVRKNTTAAKQTWMNYYTEELADLVYKKYKKDITYFGYEEKYLELKKYCRENVKGI